LNHASLKHHLRGRFWEYIHNFCSDCYEKLDGGENSIEIDRDKVPLIRLDRGAIPGRVSWEEEAEAAGR